MKMRCAFLVLPAGLVLLLAGPGGAAAGGGDKDKPVKVPANPVDPALVEVRFTNGSVVVMNMLQDKIEIVTEYGKLTVPPRDIRSIEFGVHATDEEIRKLNEAIKHLGSTSHQERETAVEDLVAMGPLAYLRLQKEVGATDLEVSRRAESTLKAIRARYPTRLLRARDEDVVRTGKFSIVGRITTPTLKAKADDFGDLDLRPARLLAIRWLSADTRKEVVVDAPSFGGPGNNKWMATGVKVEAGVGLKITASGQVDLLPQQPGQRICGPDGNGGGGGFGGKGRIFQPNGGQPGGELLGRIGDSGIVFLIGSRHTMTPKTGGQLHLMIAQSPWGCPSSGEYRVTVASGPLMDDHDADD
jgi:hypothetical protein